MEKVLSVICLVLAAICIAAGLPRVKLELSGGIPLVVLFLVFITAAIVFAWRDAKKRYEE
ncbi:hypothetical protein HZB93_02990 [Candidatus Falkowbacteria bacterium]|nr:hypothetical protein [Candidatus Falkowbacteria bacterium]